MVPGSNYECTPHVEISKKQNCVKLNNKNKKYERKVGYRLGIYLDLSWLRIHSLNYVDVGDKWVTKHN